MTKPGKQSTKKCAFCAEEIRAEAKKCKHCGEYLDEHVARERGQTAQQWSPGVAAVLSLFLPGAGQVYRGKVFEGIMWFLSVLVGYFLFVIPGLVLHVLCILDARNINPYPSAAEKKTESLFDDEEGSKPSRPAKKKIQPEQG